MSSGDGLVACSKRKIPCPFRFLADRLCTSDNSDYPDASIELVLFKFWSLPSTCGHEQRKHRPTACKPEWSIFVPCPNNQ